MVKYVALALILLSCSSKQSSQSTSGSGATPSTPTGDNPMAVSLTASKSFTNGSVTLLVTASGALSVAIMNDETILSQAQMFEWDTRAVAEGPHRLVARALGVSGAVESEPIVVTVDRTAPKLLRSSPANGSANAAAILTPFAQFDEPLTAGAFVGLASTILDDKVLAPRQTRWAPARWSLQVSGVTDRAGNAVSVVDIAASVPSIAVLGSAKNIQTPALWVDGDAAMAAFVKDGAVTATKTSLSTEEEVSLGTIASGSDPVVGPGPTVAIVAGEQVVTYVHSGSAWTETSRVSGDMPRLGQGVGGTVVAVRQGARLQALSALELPGPPLDYAFVAGETAYLAIVGADQKLSVFRHDGAWVQIGGAELQAEPDAKVEHVSLAVQGGMPVVAWAETSAVLVAEAPLGLRNVYVSKFGAAGWARLGRAVDLRPKDDAFDPFVAAGADLVYLTFRENGRQQLAAFDTDWRFLGGGHLDTAALRLTSDGLPVTLTTNGKVSRLNVNPSAPPPGLVTRVPNTTCQVPEDIADGASIATTSCYSDVAAHIANAAAVPYDLIQPLWTDGAEKHRYVVLPPGAKLGYNDYKAWEVPVGTVLIKEFYWNDKPMETRILVKREELRWTGYSFRWNTTGSDAVLVTGDGERGFFDGHQHVFPARTDCTRCHNNAVGGTIGLLTANLNRSRDYDGVTASQLQTFAALDMLDGGPTPAAPAPRLASSEDTSQSYEFRSRSYLQANCVHCHSTYHTGAGEAPRWGPWYYPLSHTNLCDHNHIDEGSHATSVIWRRDQNYQNAGRMPPIGTLVTDPTNDVLLRTWIDTMQVGDCPPWDKVVYTD